LVRANIDLEEVLGGALEEVVVEAVDLEEVVVLEAAMMLDLGEAMVEVLAVAAWKKPSLVCLEMTTPFLLKYLKPPSSVMAKWMEVTMLILRQSARCFTSVPMMEMEVSPSTASSAPMELSSNSSTLSVNGGSMWTALLPRNSILSMRNMQLKELPTLPLALLVVPVVMRVLAALVEGLVVNGMHIKGATTTVNIDGAGGLAAANTIKPATPDKFFVVQGPEPATTVIGCSNAVLV